jgi:uncharacterized protein (DUF934 family)
VSEVRIWTEKGFVADDPWITVEAEADLPAEGDVIVPLERFSALSAEFGSGSGEGRNTRRVGVIIAPDDDLAEIADRLEDISLIALQFPKFSDGRSYSHAARLREQYDFKGEMRALGDVLIDQIPLMKRVGIESFAVSHEPTLKRLSEGRLPGISRHYQPTALPARKARGYSWRRLPV